VTQTTTTDDDPDDDAAGRLWKPLDFRRESAMLTAW
jgi:hypothetical protein